MVEPRYDELFTLIQAELRRSGYEDLVPAGIVLTGGTAKMEGAVDLAEEIFHMPVRLGVPHSVKGLADVVRNPIYSTGVGLLLYGLHKQADGVPCLDSATLPTNQRRLFWIGSRVGSRAILSSAL